MKTRRLMFSIKNSRDRTMSIEVTARNLTSYFGVVMPKLIFILIVILTMMTGCRTTQNSNTEQLEPMSSLAIIINKKELSADVQKIAGELKRFLALESNLHIIDAEEVGNEPFQLVLGISERSTAKYMDVSLAERGNVLDTLPRIRLPVEERAIQGIARQVISTLARDYPQKVQNNINALPTMSKETKINDGKIIRILSFRTSRWEKIEVFKSNKYSIAGPSSNAQLTIFSYITYAKDKVPELFTYDLRTKQHIKQHFDFKKGTKLHLTKVRFIENDTKLEVCQRKVCVQHTIND